MKTKILSQTELQREKVSKYVITSSSFYDGGIFEIWLESARYKKLELTPPLYSLPLKRRKDKFSYFGYTMDPMADTVAEMSSRVLVWEAKNIL